ncbi:hypothetical protein FACS1894211_16350 [Clostridia bacterium]|nr:hypothetical protein FACS1894211_16350 [Clostridia bacterium]
MNMIKIVKAEPKPDSLLRLTFSDGKEGIYDVKPILNFGRFAELKDVALFRSVRIADATIEWGNGADLCPESVYEETVFLS